MPAFRRSLLGYRRRDVDAAIAELQARLAEAERAAEAAEAADIGANVGRHLASLLSRFADAVEAGEREAQEAAQKIIADAEARAAAIDAEVARRYAEVAATKEAARSRVEEALEQLSATMASLEAVPELPRIEVSS